MTLTEAVALFKQALWMTVLLSAPMLIFGLVAGLIVSVFQAVTQIHEMTLTFIPKLIAVTGMFIFLLPWMLSQLTGYLSTVLRSLPTLSH